MKKNILEQIKDDFTRFLDEYFLLKNELPDFYEHYIRSAAIARVIGRITKEFKEENKLVALMEATKYCDLGLDIEIKKGKQIPADEKKAKLESHVQKSMDILRGGQFFFKNSILLIAWHHWQPDELGYVPTHLPALNMYKEGGNIIAISTAFDSIFSRNYNKTKNIEFSIAIALYIIHQNTGTQFSQTYYELLEKALTKGFEQIFRGKKIHIKISPVINKMFNFMLQTGNINFKECIKNYHRADTGNKTTRLNKDNTLEKFDSYFQRALSGELYNISEINNYLEKMTEIIAENMNHFTQLFIKMITFMAQFTYPDGEIKSFVMNSFFKGIDRHFMDSTKNSIELFMSKVFIIWELYLNDSIEPQLKYHFTENIYQFFYIIKLIKDNYQFSKVSIPKHILTSSDEIIYQLTEKTLHIYNPDEIDFIKSKIGHIKEFNKIWT